YLFFFNDTATTEIYPLSLHDALPISRTPARHPFPRVCASSASGALRWRCRDRKSTRLNSSHPSISDAVFCLKKEGPRIGLHVADDDRPFLQRIHFSKARRLDFQQNVRRPFFNQRAADHVVGVNILRKMRS